MNETLVKSLYKIGKSWDKYNVFQGISKKGTNPFSVDELIANTYCPGPYMTCVFDFLTMEFEDRSPSTKGILGYEDFEVINSFESYVKLLPSDERDNHAKREDRSMSFAQKNIKVEDVFHYKLVFTVNLRKSDGTYVKVLHQGIPLSTNGFGQINKLLCIQVDMSHFDHYDDKDISFISLNSSYPSYHSINKWADHSMEESGEYELTVKQKEILSLIAEGKKSKEISIDLGVSVETVKSHRKEMLERSGKATMYELLSDCIDKGVIQA